MAVPVLVAAPELVAVTVDVAESLTEGVLLDDWLIEGVILAVPVSVPVTVPVLLPVLDAVGDELGV